MTTRRRIVTQTRRLRGACWQPVPRTTARAISCFDTQRRRVLQLCAFFNQQSRCHRTVCMRWLNFNHPLAQCNTYYKQYNKDTWTQMTLKPDQINCNNNTVGNKPQPCRRNRSLYCFRGERVYVYDLFSKNLPNTLITSRATSKDNRSCPSLVSRQSAELNQIPHQC